jgi:antitoxin component of MazEF toxin-antitoxin module
MSHICTKTIRKIGNGAFLPLTQDVLGALGAEIGTSVEIIADEGKLTVAPVEGGYERTRRAAKQMRQRYRKTLDILAR